MAALLVPLLIVGILLYGLRQGVDLFSAMVDGARSGLKTTARILPSLVVLMAAVSLFRACGIQTLLSRMLRPVFSLLGIPAETAPLMLIRPFSGSAALAVGSDLMTRYGADSLVGRTAAVMLGSTETTFYTVAVYFGAAGIRKTRHTIPAALCADLAGFLAASLTVRLFWG